MPGWASIISGVSWTRWQIEIQLLEFFAYVGSPWFEYAYRGEKKRLGDLYTPSPLRGLAHGDLHFHLAGRRDRPGAFPDERPCAPEFQHCRDQEEAYRIARQLLRQVIAYAHERKIEVWLGKGIARRAHNLGRHARHGWARRPFRPHDPASDPLGVEIWTAVLDSMVNDYPEADGVWLWLAELYFHSDDPESRKLIASYEPYRRLIPSVAEMRAMGYDQYLKDIAEQDVFESDITALHYAKALMAAACAGIRTSAGRLGAGPLLPVPALDAVLPRAWPAEHGSLACWNRRSRVPMENFGKVRNRDLFVVPGWTMTSMSSACSSTSDLRPRSRDPGQCRIRPGGRDPAGRQDARSRAECAVLAEGAWQPALTPAAFYDGYTRALFGSRAFAEVREAYRILEDNEFFLGLGVPAEGTTYFQGMGNSSTTPIPATWGGSRCGARNRSCRRDPISKGNGMCAIRRPRR